MNIQEAWAYGRQRLAQVSSSPDLDSRLLLEHALDARHSFLIAHGEELLSPEQESQYHHLISRAERREPIPYITGKIEFFGLSMEVSPAVLIPRPETEQLVELAVAWVRQSGANRIMDVGTGSGCIAISLASQIHDAEIWATDISPEALIMAQRNARRHVPGRIKFLESDLLDQVDFPLDLIIANLPYVADDEWTSVDDAVKWYEPTVALSGGPDGLDLIGELLQQAMSRLAPDGAIFLEIGWQQGSEAQNLARNLFKGASITLKTDYAGLDRFLIIQNRWNE